MPNPDTLKSTKESLQKMQKFDISRLPRSEELGSQLNFSEIVPDAEKIKELYTKLSVACLEDFTDNILQIIQDQARNDFDRFQTILDFNPIQGSSIEDRNNLINAVRAGYQEAFNILLPYLSYSASKTPTISKIETELDATREEILNKADALMKDLESTQTKANDTLSNIQKIAAEQGVSQQASYFQEEAKDHSTHAGKWGLGTIFVSILTVVFAASSLFLHKLPYLKPENSYDSIQLIAGKLLIFGILSYMLVLCAKNFLSHKHNGIVNKHRQNALMTFQSLVEASGDNKTKEVVLTHASSCIFSPQDTGYSKPGGSTVKSAVELLPRIVMPENNNTVDADAG